MDLGLADRTYVVTGGSSGVGLATVRALLDEGANVATCGRDAERLDRIGAHDRLFTAVCDVRDAAAVRDFVGAGAERFGGRLDGLVNNAGQSRMKRLDETTEDDWRDELELKFAGVLGPVQAARKYLSASDAASVVNVNAVLAKQPEPRLITTSAARAGILNLSKSLATELASDGIRVNSVCLGLIDTGQWTRRHAAADSGLSYDDWQAELAADRGVALGRLGRAEEVAYAILALLAPRASYITGTSIDVCGGVGRGIL
ncbi:SDR family oxidoreductase [Streptomyces sp. VRA16 Mangrove soil]|uniref:SDR family oxidoreductase n=1 Tax=Streptomyces sp. VRA16 Mangrove soil TaxID=2817434 RepID=UPI001A9F6C9A|nr:SDR family oxidoreductase [Streptomyces sp. VRA16 Mangrove soil]MBO1331833.1 SDR family oxidoreductase [Streptomyces sp. VRA16 Mangrove soil]